jgi:nicotinamidase-related amidase
MTKQTTAEQDGVVQVDGDSTALIVVDMQNDFCHPDGELYADGSEAVIPAVRQTIFTLSTAVNRTIVTRDTHGQNDPEFDEWGRHCVGGTWGQEIHGDVRNALSVSSYIEVEKNTYDAFFETPLDSLLGNVGIETVIICGTLANVCVQETAASANLHGYDVIVLEDAVGYITEEQRRRALEHIEFLVGDVVTRNELVVE